MRGIILTASLAVLVGVSSVGCKSVPSLTWWRTASTTDANATAVAHTAPALPSDVAIQTEGLAANIATTAGGIAAPYVPTAASAVSPAGYPNTGAPSYLSTVASSAVATPAMNDSNLGTIDMPYNPNAVPPAATVAPATTVAPAATVAAAPIANRYSTTATPSNAATNTLSNSDPQFSDAGSRYATPTASSTTPAYNTTPVTSFAPPPAPTTVPPANNYGATMAGATGPVGDRYAQPTTTTSAPAAQASITTDNFGTSPKTSPVQTTQTIATTEPYRPGATSTYPGATSEPLSIEMASRPEPPDSPTGSSVPNVATPNSTPAPLQSAPQVPRYW
ncbi:MAG: hypothetical protein IH898_05955 [Planctomycetes bacterium]|nr:hypothetical protein [Planctomycetota bacterium]